MSSSEAAKHCHELQTVLCKYDLRVDLTMKDNIGVKYRKDQDILELLTEMNKNDNFIITGTNTLRHFNARYHPRNITLVLPIDASFRAFLPLLEETILETDPDVRITRQDNELTITHEDAKPIVHKAIREVHLVIDHVTDSSYHLEKATKKEKTDGVDFEELLGTFSSLQVAK